MIVILTIFLSEPFTEILGGPDIYLEEGFTMNLTCLVRDSPEPPQYIFWYHNQQPISYYSVRGGISQITEKGDITASFLLIQEAKIEDSGRVCNGVIMWQLATISSQLGVLGTCNISLRHHLKLTWPQDTNLCLISTSYSFSYTKLPID